MGKECHPEQRSGTPLSWKKKIQPADQPDPQWLKVFQPDKQEKPEKRDKPEKPDKPENQRCWNDTEIFQHTVQFDILENQGRKGRGLRRLNPVLNQN